MLIARAPVRISFGGVAGHRGRHRGSADHFEDVTRQLQCVASFFFLVHFWALMSNVGHSCPNSRKVL